LVLVEVVVRLEGLHILEPLPLITFLLLAEVVEQEVQQIPAHQVAVGVVVLAGLVLMGLPRLQLVDFQAEIFTTAERLVQMLWAVAVEAGKALLLYRALQAVLNGVVVLVVEAEPPHQLAIVVAVGQFLAVVVAVAAVILRVVLLDAALAEVHQLT
jgi:hypothetical protein